MYKSMYPLVHLTSQNNPNEGRQFMSTPALDFYHLVNGDMPYTQRKEFLLQAHSAINLANNGKQQMVPSNGANNGKTFYNTSNKRENWASNRGHGKPKRLQHGLSAPCLTNAATDESSDSGLSRSPTPSRRSSNHCFFNTINSTENTEKVADIDSTNNNAMITPFCTAPDRFLLRSHLMQIKHIPEELSDGTVWEQSYYPKYGLYMVGSTMNGFGIESSDVDMCLVIRHAEVDQRNEALSYLKEILNIFSQCEYVENLELIQAKVPILKFRDSKQGMQVDLNCNNSVGIRNTHLLYCYGRMDWRVRPLVMIVKIWAHWHNINDAKNMTLSSYSLALMVIHFLQCAVNPPVLCCLHNAYKEKFNSSSEIGTIDIHEELDPFISENKQSLGELLVQFFQYYATFDFLQFAISVRLASVIPIEECRMVRMPKNDPHQWKLICIEEPFDLTNTARSVYDAEKFKHIRNVIARSAHALYQTRNLESIFTLNPPLV
uniref:Uncharacterized protein n=1 Tax=Rhodnius prolixus TaxID=13249 RepID=T1HJ60_RHOPR